ncbi:MAG: hypothetical protein HOE45_02200 [Gammaproteobacteria bacterium]|jgi:hypothetical protein|nr:hypothetical protein [Gammaproteobacteria bacterium]MBT5222743.1 hypothetical protein [Gammaproteobacteria bacterium]MBT6420375.1 hypothetical protein [Gammaproteobacteria bacterium]MBT6574766.1 hypothetical protein [Gammaproteobacteria bacterium]
MKIFKIYIPENTIPSANTLLTRVKDPLGFVPNVFAVIAGFSPALKRLVT